MNNIAAFLQVNNHTALIILLGVLGAFVVLLTVLGIVFIVAVRRRRPVVKVLMPPEGVVTGSENATSETAAVAASSQPKDGVPVYIIEDYESLYYRGFTNYPYLFSDEIQVKKYPTERYSSVKNDFRSYEKVKERTSNTRNGYRVGRLTTHSSGRRYTKSKKGIRIATAKRKSI